MTVKLDILNTMLAAIGSSQINSTAGRHPGLILSEPILDRINRTVQVRGHWFNTDWGFELLPTVGGEFLLPVGTLKADTTVKSEPYVRRGRTMYDPYKHTHILPDLPNMQLDIVIQLDYEDLPIAALDLIQTRAVYDVVKNSGADAISIKTRDADVRTASMAFEVERMSQADYTLRDNPQYARIMGGLKPMYATRSPTNLGG